MKILLICGNGVSSGIAQKIRKAGIARGYDAVSDAYSYSQLSEVVDEFDVVLVAPQMKFNEDMIRDICALHQKPYAVLDNFVYSTLDGERGFDTVLSLLNEKEKV